MQYLILQNGAPVTNSRLYEVLWPSESSSNPESALKTLISRMRVTLAQYNATLGKCIVTERGSYRFNTELGIEVDLYQFNALAQELARRENIGEEERRMFDRAINLYEGDLLSGNELESWAAPHAIELHGIYIAMVNRYIKALEEQCAWDDVIYVCRRALEVDPFEEQLHVALMDAMLKKGNVNEALMQHKHASESYYKYLGMPPPEGIQEFYKQIISADKALDESLSDICEELKNQSENLGAFVCEYAIFKEIYSLQMRNLERIDMKLYVMLVMLSGMDGNPIESIKLNNMMQGLQEVMRNGLRKGDVISQFSASQFALLLPMDAKESCTVVMERVKRAFYKRYPRSNVVITYRISSIDKVTEISKEPTQAD